MLFLAYIQYFKKNADIGAPIGFALNFISLFFISSYYFARIEVIPFFDSISVNNYCLHEKNLVLVLIKRELYHGSCLQRKIWNSMQKISVTFCFWVQSL